MNKQDKSQIKQLLQDPKWQVVENVAKEITQSVKDQSNLRETLWETGKSVAFEEGQIQGINQLLKRLYKEAQDA